MSIICFIYSFMRNIKVLFMDLIIFLSTPIVHALSGTMILYKGYYCNIAGKLFQVQIIPLPKKESIPTFFIVSVGM